MHNIIKWYTRVLCIKVKAKNLYWQHCIKNRHVDWLRSIYQYCCWCAIQIAWSKNWPSSTETPRLWWYDGASVNLVACTCGKVSSVLKDIHRFKCVCSHILHPLHSVLIYIIQSIRIAIVLLPKNKPKREIVLWISRKKMCIFIPDL